MGILLNIIMTSFILIALLILANGYYDLENKKLAVSKKEGDVLKKLIAISKKERAELLKERDELMKKHRKSEPRIDPEYMFRVEKNPYVSER